MEELRYKVDLLNAMNQRLVTDEKMYRLICDTSSNAFYMQILELMMSERLPTGLSFSRKWK